MTGHPPGEADLDALLAAYHRELEYFASTAELLMPVMRALLAAIDAAFLTPEDPQVIAGARNARAHYIETLAGLKPLIDDWLRVRGANQRAWEAEPYMDDARFERLQELGARETRLALERGEFDALQELVRHRLLLFEELLPGS